jgi:hypothetical protein
MLQTIHVKTNVNPPSLARLAALREESLPAEGVRA